MDWFTISLLTKPVNEYEPYQLSTLEYRSNTGVYMQTQDITDSDKSILLFLIKNGNESTHATGIAEKSGKLSKAWSQKRCAYLKEKGVLDYDMIRPARQKNETEHYHIASTIDVVRIIFDIFKEDHNLLNNVIMRSLCRENMTCQLSDHFDTQLINEGLPEMSENARKFLKNVLPWSESVLQFVLDETPDKIGKTFKRIETENIKKRPYIEKEIDKRLDDLDYMGDLVKVVTNLIKSCDVGTVEEQEMPPIDSDGLKKWYTQNQSDIIDLFVTSWTPDIWMTMLSVLTTSDSILYHFDRDGICELVFDV